MCSGVLVVAAPERMAGFRLYARFRSAGRNHHGDLGGALARRYWLVMLPSPRRFYVLVVVFIHLFRLGLRSANDFYNSLKVGGPFQPAIQWWDFGCFINLFRLILSGIGIVYHFVPLLSVRFFSL